MLVVVFQPLLWRQLSVATATPDPSHIKVVFCFDNSLKKQLGLRLLSTQSTKMWAENAEANQNYSIYHHQ